MADTAIIAPGMPLTEWSLQRGQSATPERVFSGAVMAAGLLVLVLMGAIIVMLAKGAWPALQTFGIGFFWNPVWDSVHEVFGAGIMVYGTLLTSILALLIAVPLSLGVAYFLTELVRPGLRRPIGVVISCSPRSRRSSTACGAFSCWHRGWPRTSSSTSPTFVDVPVLNKVLDYGWGNSIFTAGLVLAVMILPLISAMFVEILGATPVVLKESVYGLGVTRFEVIRHVAISYGRRAMIGAIMLGLDR